MSESLKQKTVNGVIWSAVERFSTLAIQMVCTLIIAQFLSPADFGIVGMITIFTGIAQCLVDSGFRTALIRKKDVTDIDYSSVFYFNVLVSLLLYAILYVASPYIATFYSQPLLESVSKITFLVIPVSALGLVHGTIMTRSLAFKAISRVTIIAALSSGIVGITLAVLYKNLWAIVVQNILFYVMQTLLLWLSNNWKPLIAFSLASIKSMFGFSFNMMLSSLIGTIFNNIHGLLIGKLYTPSDLGNYSQAQKLQSLPSTSITEVIQRVTYPVLSKYQDDDNKLKSAYKRMIGVAFLIVSFVMFWLMGISTVLFDILFNKEWSDAGKYFAILCLNGVFYPLHSININILTVKGKSKVYLTLEICRRIMFLSVVCISAFFSIYIFVWGMVVYSILALILNLTICGHYIQYSFLEQIKDLLPTFLIGLFTMLLIKFGIGHFFINKWILITTQTAVGLTCMFAIPYYTHNKYLKELIGIMKGKLGKATA